MSEQTNVKILAFVGLAGSGKSTAVDYLRSKHYPEVHANSPQEQAEDPTTEIDNNGLIRQIDDLASAGQHRIVLDDINSLSGYKTLKHTFPRGLIVVSLLASKHARHHRLTTRKQNPLAEAEALAQDWNDIEVREKAGPIVFADHYIMNNNSIDELQNMIDEYLQEIKF